MARTALIAKQRHKPKFPTRAYSRCNLCGRTRSFIRQFGVCRICFRNLAHKGEIPGVKKASW